MLPTQDQDDRNRWLPLAIGVIGALISCLIWRMVLDARESALLERTSSLAAESRAALQQEVDRQIHTLTRLRDRWDAFGTSTDSEWQTAADLWVDTIPGLTNISWTERTPSEASRIVTGNAIDPPPGGAAVERPDPASPTAPVLEGPHLEDGTYTYRLRLPTLDPDQPVKMLDARFSVRGVLDHALYAHADDHAIEVSWGDDVVYTRGTPIRTPDHDWWERVEDVDLPLGTVWSVRLRPNDALAARWLTNLPHFLLAAGLALSLASALAVHGVRSSLSQTRALERANRALSDQSRELESAVVERTQNLETAVAALESFNRTVSHDLRSPIGAILNYCSILEEDYTDQALDDEGLQILERIHRSANRANLLLSDLLELSRAGQAPLEREHVDMTQLAREAFAQACAAESGEDEAPAVSFTMDALPSATGDATLLATVFDNLMTNALKYSIDTADRRIHVSGRIDHDELLYEVEDNGCGFDSKHASKVFELFERLHSNEEIDGTGVGLAIVQQIVRRHGGRVWAHGEPGKGARIGFALPSRSHA